ncbi:hypothetical protein EVAR_5734_1 [Eumeta japonica]|uniref:Uncharacterized protein n=1 Tax=Eumeta variegata TaxID=151549 RepID=A0A4C1T597_EUMVA|nr:hypothetical protein EVAR_5734_1 [Eumeta japonica]
MIGTGVENGTGSASMKGGALAVKNKEFITQVSILSLTAFITDCVESQSSSALLVKNGFMKPDYQHSQMGGD